MKTEKILQFLYYKYKKGSTVDEIGNSIEMLCSDKPIKEVEKNLNLLQDEKGK